MILDPDLEQLAVDSRQRLTREFAEKYVNLNERMRRVPVEEANKIAVELSCPLQVAMMAYIINIDGIMSLKEVVDILTQELRRRTEAGISVPNLPGNIQEFVITEGRWIQHNYGTLTRDLELKVRELSNLESSLDEEQPPVEKAVSVLEARVKLAETFIAPMVQAWLDDHQKANSEHVLMAFGPAITKWKRRTLKGRFTQLRRRNQALFRLIRSALQTAEDSATIGSTIARIDELIEGLEVPLDKMDVRATSHFLVHIAPRATGRGDMSRTVVSIAPTTRGHKTEPDMTSPFDFLERDVRLGGRRKGEDREDYLIERIERVISVLKYTGTEVDDCVKQCVLELIDRMKLKDIPVDKIVDEAQERLAAVSPPERDTVASRLVFEFVISHIYGDHRDE